MNHDSNPLPSNWVADLETATRLVRQHPSEFIDAGARIDWDYGVEALRRRRLDDLLELQQTDSFVPGERRKRFRGHHNLGRRAGDARFERLQCCVDDLQSSLSPSMDRPEALAVVLLCWLLHDRSADEFEPRLCEFQGMAWSSIPDEAGGSFGRGFLDTSQEQALFAWLPQALAVAKRGVESLDPLDAPHPLQGDSPDPLTERERAVLEVLRGLPPTTGLTGKELVAELAKRGTLGVDEKSLRTTTIRGLRRREWKIPNGRGTRGYYLAREDRERLERLGT